MRYSVWIWGYFLLFEGIPLSILVFYIFGLYLFDITVRHFKFMTKKELKQLIKETLKEGKNDLATSNVGSEMKPSECIKKIAKILIDTKKYKNIKLDVSSPTSSIFAEFKNEPAGLIVIWVRWDYKKQTSQVDVELRITKAKWSDTGDNFDKNEQRIANRFNMNDDNQVSALLGLLEHPMGSFSREDHPWIGAKVISVDKIKGDLSYAIEADLTLKLKNGKTVQIEAITKKRNR